MLFNAFFTLFISYVFDDGAHIILSQPRYSGHITKGPVMGSRTILYGEVKGFVSMMRWLVNFVYKGRSLPGSLQRNTMAACTVITV